jgi:hypothetical protein
MSATRDLSQSTVRERERLLESAQAVVSKADGTNALLDEIAAHLRPAGARERRRGG